MFLDRVSQNDVMVLTGQVPRSGTGEISHVVRFTAPSNEMRATITWNIYNRTRFVGVNVDLTTSDGALVGSDAFTGTLATRAAVSTLDVSSLTPNQVYILKVSGVQTSGLNYSIAIEFGPP
ncbi:hypothetical protein JOD31_002394 [Methylopila capsulata]|uniref:Fibronectin type-III domain-containing protein n=1 Tax=Methylopila capsulata TaxID=61654 RepID=A0ABS2T7K7_9HYPH|nr:hypothetical protein [Methylopila capsulata]MBM7852152.1 hypothetical protein [Methylopila capsulata]